MTYLDRILAAHRADAAEDRRRTDGLVETASRSPKARDFVAALTSGPGLGVISEVKRRSPSKGELHADLDPASMARAYELGTASCLSVLTDAVFFGGSAQDLEAARAAVELPVLRKDFTVSANDVCDARIMGADAVLLIVAALDDAELDALHSLAVQVGLAVLVEAHDEAEVERALAVGATLIGVNQRDLITFEVDTDRAVRVVRAIPDHVVKVAESGIRGIDDARRLADAGYDAILVGESVVTAADPAAAVGALRSVPCARRAAS